MPVFRRWGLRLLLMLLLVATAAGIYAWRTLPQMDGDLVLAGLIAPVQVKRDEADVTHILASDPRDAWMALGFVHGQERAWQLEFSRRLMRGQLSEVLGSATLDTDRLMRTLGIRSAAQQQLQGLDDATQAALLAYSQGVNAFFAQAQPLTPEFQLLGIDPSDDARAGRYWDAADTVGWSLMMALDLGGNWGHELARLTALQVLDTPALWTLFPPYPGESPAASEDLSRLYQQLGVFRVAPEQTSGSAVPQPAAGRFQQALALQVAEWTERLGGQEGLGSNNWVVDGSRSASGLPLLANDPHLGLSAPAIWYFARLHAPDVPGFRGMDVMGASLPGTPFVLLGRTQDVAWGFTNTAPDVQDLFVEEIDPRRPSHYRVPSTDEAPRWAPFETRQERIRVKGEGDVLHTVRLTRHGPVISDIPGRTHDLIDTGRYALALRWSALDADNASVEATLYTNQARSVEELLSAFRRFHSPMQNVVMADRQGRIAYKAVGKVPVRSPANGIRGMTPSPGWETRYDWQGWLPWEATPQDTGERGWIATANQRIHAADYPHFITQDWAPPYRQARIEAMLLDTPRHTVESFATIQGDLYSAATLRLLPFLRQTRSLHPLAAAAQQQLASFDGHMLAERAAPLIYTAWVDEFTRGVVGARLGQARFEAIYGKRLFRNAVEGMFERNDTSWCGPAGCMDASSLALDRALERLQAAYGSDVSTWRWGHAHPAVSAHRPMSNVNALAPLFEVRVPTGGDPFTINVGQYHLDKVEDPFANRHAASLRAIYDLSDLDNSRFIYQTGQSGNVFSTRYRDMSGTWAAVQYRTLSMNPSGWTHHLRLMPAASVR